MKDDARCTERLLVTAETLPTASMDMLLEIACAANALGLRPHPGSVRCSAAIDLLRALADRDPGAVDRALRRLPSEDAAEGAPLLEAFADEEGAALVHDLLSSRAQLPTRGILVSLLARTDQAALVRLLDTLRSQCGLGAWVFVFAAYEAEMSIGDAGGEASAELRAAIAEIEAIPWKELAWKYDGLEECWNGLLRRAARRGRDDALAAVDEGMGWFPNGLDCGMRAVFGRLGDAAEEALAFVDAVEDVTFGARCRAARHLAWEKPDHAFSTATLARLRKELAAGIESYELSPEDAWWAWFDLVGLSARLGWGDELEALVDIVRPPAWAVFSATRAAVRKLGDDDVRAAVHDLVQRLPASSDECEWSPPQPPWAALSPDDLASLWWLGTGRPELPWWTPWGSGLP